MRRYLSVSQWLRWSSSFPNGSRGSSSRSPSLTWLLVQAASHRLVNCWSTSNNVAICLAIYPQQYRCRLRRCACPRNADAFQRCSYLLGGHVLRLALRARLASGLDRWRNQPIMLKPSVFRPTSAVPSSRVHGQCLPSGARSNKGVELGYSDIRGQVGSLPGVELVPTGDRPSLHPSRPFLPRRFFG